MGEAEVAATEGQVAELPEAQRQRGSPRPSPESLWCLAQEVGRGPSVSDTAQATALGQGRDTGKRLARGWDPAVARGQEAGSAMGRDRASPICWEPSVARSSGPRCTRRRRDGGIRRAPWSSDFASLRMDWWRRWRSSARRVMNFWTRVPPRPSAEPFHTRSLRGGSGSRSPTGWNGKSGRGPFFRCRGATIISLVALACLSTGQIGQDLDHFLAGITTAGDPQDRFIDRRCVSLFETPDGEPRCSDTHAVLWHSQ